MCIIFVKSPRLQKFYATLYGILMLLSLSSNNLCLVCDSYFPDTKGANCTVILDKCISLFFPFKNNQNENLIPLMCHQPVAGYSFCRFCCVQMTPFPLKRIAYLLPSFLCCRYQVMGVDNTIIVFLSRFSPFFIRALFL